MIIEARSLTKRFESRLAVDELDLSVPQGVCYGLLGPNGAGKTTTLRMIYGVTRPTAGSIHVFGLDVSRDPRAVRKRLGVTLQENVLIEVLPPEENLRVFGRYHLMREPELSKRVEELMDLLELRSHAGLPVKALSGGFQRRLAIALSLMNRPELLVLDEPTTGLDPAVRQALWSRIRQLRATGTTILLTTHYMDEAERLCDKVAIICEGKIIAEDSPRRLIERHLARDAIELDCNAEEEAQLLQELEPAPHRLRVGSRAWFYVEDAAPIVERVHQWDGGDHRPVVVRPTNLEDVFLSLTGTHLEGGA
jgi:lipooligosaccharide transport system ATP-binding protein